MIMMTITTTTLTTDNSIHDYTVFWLWLSMSVLKQNTMQLRTIFTSFYNVSIYIIFLRDPTKTSNVCEGTSVSY